MRDRRAGWKRHSPSPVQMRDVTFFSTTDGRRAAGRGNETVRWPGGLAWLWLALLGMGWWAVEEKRMCWQCLTKVAAVFLPSRFFFFLFFFSFVFRGVAFSGDRSLLSLLFPHGVLGVWIMGDRMGSYALIPWLKVSGTICIAMHGGGCRFAKEEDGLALLNV